MAGMNDSEKLKQALQTAYHNQGAIQGIHRYLAQTLAPIVQKSHDEVFEDIAKHIRYQYDALILEISKFDKPLSIYLDVRDDLDPDSEERWRTPPKTDGTSGG